MKIASLATRAVIGGLFVGHGTQKLFGWFGGPGQGGTQQMMEALDMRPAKHHAFAAGCTETAGGALLAAGLATPLAAAGLIGTMITAIRKVHARNGVWVTNGGYEYNLVLILALLGLAESGPGEFSLDHLLGIEHKGARWALGALLLGATTSAAVIEYGRRAPATDTSYPTEAQSTAAGAAVNDPAGDPASADGN